MSLSLITGDSSPAKPGVNVVIAPGELTSPKFARAFAEGCGAGKVSTSHTLGNAWAGFGSPKTWDSLQQAIRNGDDFYYGDHSYFTDARFHYYRITKNAFQHSGETSNPTRGRGFNFFRRGEQFYKEAQPWTNDGRHILVCPQSNDHHSRYGEADWLERVTRTLQQYSDRPIIVTRKNLGKGKRIVDLRDNLVNAWCIVTHNSASAIEAIMAGVPAIVTGDSAASPYSLRDPANVEHPMRPDFDRMRWIATLAANQWTLAEIKNGVAWRNLN